MDDLKQVVVNIYKQSGYQHVGETASGLKFSNMFSRHYVFTLPDVAALKKTWRTLHEEVLREYLDFRDESFVEWNFYCVFLIEAPEVTPMDRIAIQDIEQDRSYSRKFVRTVSEINALPPGRILAGELGTKETIRRDISKLWEETLGTKLYAAIVSDPKRNIEKRVLKVLEGNNE